MTTTTLPLPSLHATAAREARDSVVVRFAGDSDGIQLTGNRFAAVTALAGNDLATFPDFPAEIRAPIGTTYGVSAFQINFGARAIKTSGDAPDVLVALNPAALKVELPRLKPDGIIIVDTGSFTERNLRKAGYATDPLTDGSLADHRVIEVDVSKLTLEVAKPFGLSQHDALRCKNFWTLGLVYWMFDRDRSVTAAWLNKRFADRPTIAQANIAALDAGHAFGETAELSGNLIGYSVAAAALAPGLYRTITGGEALAWGLVVGAHLADLTLFFAPHVNSYKRFAIAACSDPAAQPGCYDVPGGRRDCRRLRCHRRFLCRRARSDIELRPWISTEKRSARTRGRVAAAGRHARGDLRR